MGKIAVITGVTGQDGSYLSELLLKKDYNVIGLIRRSSTDTKWRLENVLDNQRFMLLESDLTDPSSINYIVNRYKPDEFYNLAAQSHVGTSFEQPHFTFQVDAIGVLNVLEAVRHFSPHTRFYQASTSEMFGSNYTTGYELGQLGPTQYDERGNPILTTAARIPVKYQDENTPLSPNSPYAVAKVAAHNMVRLYRQAYNIHGSCGILFNHESERRGDNFVTKKITKYIAKLSRFRNGKDALKGTEFPKLGLGNLDAKRDWGYAPEYVEAMWLMLQQEIPDDYVIATGKTNTVREFLNASFNYIGVKKWEKYVYIDPQFYRPSEVEFLLGKPEKAKLKLGWESKVGITELVQKMVDYDIKRL